MKTKTQAERYADNVIDALSIGQITIKDLRQIIINAWKAGYNAGKNNNSSNNQNDTLDFIDIDELNEELKKRNKDSIYPAIEPINPWGVPLVAPNQPYPNITPNVPWLPIVYC